jgi:uncharacterized protein involved in exopolysaccharide biosynthesis
MKAGSDFDDEITLKEVILKISSWFRYLIGNWKIILFFTILGCGFGFYHSKNQSPVYTARCTFVMEGGGASSTNTGGLASLIGIDLQGSPGLFQAQNIMALYQSRLMIEKTLFTEVKLQNKKVLLLDRYLEFNRIAPSWKEVPDSSRSEILKSVINNIRTNHLTIETISLIAVTVEAQDEYFAKAFAETLVDNVNRFYIETKTKKSLEALTILQRQADSIKRVVNMSMRNAASSTDANPNTNAALQILKVPSQRQQIDVQNSTAIYNEVVRNIETTKMALRRETPLIQVVDLPFFPLDKSQSNMTTSLLIGGFLGAFLSIVALTLVNLYQKLMSA